MKSPSDLLYDEYVAFQKEHLAMWGRKLHPDLYEEVKTFVLSQNFKAASLPTGGTSEKHRVYRGQDLVQIIMDWPALKPPYRLEPAPEVATKLVENIVQAMAPELAADNGDDCI